MQDDEKQNLIAFHLTTGEEDSGDKKNYVRTKSVIIANSQPNRNNTIEEDEIMHEEYA